MVFSSPIFLFLFLPCVCLTYLIVSKLLPSSRNLFLLLSSLVFYSWGEPRLVIVMLGTTLLSFLFGLLLAEKYSPAFRKIALFGGLSFIFLQLAFFKYAEFLTSICNSVFLIVDLPPVGLPSIWLPLGISFYSFQAASYLVDIYRGAALPQRNFVNTSLYIALFPQLIAGPIVRYTEIEEQLRERTTSVDDLQVGISRFMIGLAKKVLIANSLAEVADYAFGLPDSGLSTSIAWIGILAYTLQIYFDFSGYSDMAIGLGRIFGFRIPENFNLPYAALSITDFWRRWHITLSRWFRDYLYIPLGGNRAGSARTYFNLVMVFFLCGLWHGASWTFVAWGLFHGCFLVLERIPLLRERFVLPAPIKWAYCMLVVMLGWVLFRADSFSHAWFYTTALLGFGSSLGDAGIFVTMNPEVCFVFLIAVCLSTPVCSTLSSLLTQVRSGTFETITRSLAYTSLLILVAAKLASGVYNPFIYFRF